jgi:hypothetical protein
MTAKDLTIVVAICIAPVNPALAVLLLLAAQL